MNDDFDLDGQQVGPAYLFDKTIDTSIQIDSHALPIKLTQRIIIYIESGTKFVKNL